MLDEDEYAIAYKLYGEALTNTMLLGNKALQFKPLLDYYKHIAGLEETNPNIIMHHRIAAYGPPCENCGKPYRTQGALLCAECGNKRQIN